MALNDVVIKSLHSFCCDPQRMKLKIIFFILYTKTCKNLKHRERFGES